jgi:hypothetical protein
MDNSINEMENTTTTRVQVSRDGYLLTNGEVFSTEVYLGEGAIEWQEVEDVGQMNIEQGEI